MRRITRAQAERMHALRQHVEEQAIAFNAARAEFEAFREEVFEEMQSFHDDRSEQWQESNAGQAFQSWMQEWEEEIAEEVDENIREFPEAVP